MRPIVKWFILSLALLLPVAAVAEDDWSVPAKASFYVTCFQAVYEATNQAGFTARFCECFTKGVSSDVPLKQWEKAQDEFDPGVQAAFDSHTRACEKSVTAGERKL